MDLRHFLVSTHYDTVVRMKKRQAHKVKNRHFPVVTSRGEDGYYIVQCPTLPGCVTQGRTLDEALKNIREAIELCLEEKENRIIADEFGTEEVGLHTVTV